MIINTRMEIEKNTFQHAFGLLNKHGFRCKNASTETSWFSSNPNVTFSQPSQKDHQILQNDLKELENWASKWGMRFNAKNVTSLVFNRNHPIFISLIMKFCSKWTLIHIWDSQYQRTYNGKHI